MSRSVVNIGVFGSCGRMGLQIVNSIKDNAQASFSGAYDVRKPRFSESPFEIESLETVVKNSDVLIDFSSPDGLKEHLNHVIEQKKSIVIGTTGFQDVHKDIITIASQKVPCLVSPNMSFGMNVLFKIVGELSLMLSEDYDFEIIEKHHNSKKDAPGGTALELLDRIIQFTGRDRQKDVSYGRHGRKDLRKNKEVGIHAVRAGGIVGEHTVLYASEADSIEITHKVQNRRTFADGAVRGALFLVDKRPGLYSLQDLLSQKGL